MKKIKIETKRASLLCSIDLSELDQNHKSEFRFNLMNRWGTIEFHPDKIILPWYQFKRSLFSFASNTRSKGIEISFDELSKSLIVQFARDRRGFNGEYLNFPEGHKGIQNTLTEVGFTRNLTSKQIKDVEQLIRLYHGANFSVPGAGKTTSLLAIFSLLRNLGVVNKLMVVCPINAFISWDTEIKEIFGGKLKVHRLTKNEIENFLSSGFPTADVYITNYEKLRSGIDGLITQFLQNDFHLTLDESHRIKSGFSNQSFSQIIQLGDSAKRRDIMSGTPMPQSYIDIESQFEFLWPTERIVPTKIIDKTTSAEIHERIKPLYVRTTKNDLKLEPVKYKITEVKMGPIQKELFNLLRSESARILANMEREKLQTFRFLGRCVVRLMQASTNPMLLTSSEDIYDDIEGIPADSEVWNLLDEYGRYEKPAKFVKLKERVEQIFKSNKDAKILVWSIFVKNIHLLSKMFSDYNPAVIYGGVSSSNDETIEESREGQIRKFHEDDSCRIMIANPQACGEGISLHRVCHHAIYLERNYNAAHYLQSMDRIHRFGLPPGTETTIELLITNESLDQRIDYRLREKIAQMSAILNDKFLEAMAYDPYDIHEENNSGLDTSDIEEIRLFITSGNE